MKNLFKKSLVFFLAVALMFSCMTDISHAAQKAGENGTATYTLNAELMNKAGDELPGVYEVKATAGQDKERSRGYLRSGAQGNGIPER